VLHAPADDIVPIAAGDNFPLRSEGGLLNAIALLLFIATMLASVVRGKREPATQGAA